MKLNLHIECDNLDELRSVTDSLAGRTETVVVNNTVEAPTTEAPVTENKTAEAPSVDKDGMPYDDAIHATPPSTKANGTWKVRKGQADAEKTARAAFKASGGNVEPPVTPTTEAPVEETKAAPVGLPGQAPATGLPGATVEPVSLDAVMGKATTMFEAKQVDAETLGRLYNETVGTPDPAQAFELYQTDETARAGLMAKLTEIENG